MTRPIAPLLIVSGDFVKTGGMDAANHALAAYAARQPREVHLVAHRVSDELRDHPNVSFHAVPKPGNSYLLGAPLLDRIGRHWAGHVTAGGGRVIVNGGNCRWGDANWVHYVHAAFEPAVHGSMVRKARARVARWHALHEERLALRAARVIITNSRRTRDDVIGGVGVSAASARTVYYGVDPLVFSQVTPEEQRVLRQRFAWPIDTPIAVFVGALGDRRKGFDTVFSAWELLCRDSAWDAQLIVVGTGGELDHWRARAQARGMTGRIAFLGFRTDVADVLAASDILVHPARYEAYGLAVQEALTRGLPALVSAGAGVAERYPAELRDLLLPDAEDAGDLCDRLRIWRHNIAAVRMKILPFAKGLRERTWDVMAAEVLSAVEAPGEVTRHAVTL